MYGILSPYDINALNLLHAYRAASHTKTQNESRGCPADLAEKFEVIEKHIGDLHERLERGISPKITKDLHDVLELVNASGSLPEIERRLTEAERLTQTVEDLKNAFATLASDVSAQKQELAALDKSYRDADLTTRLHESAQQFDERLDKLTQRIDGVERERRQPDTLSDTVEDLRKALEEFITDSQAAQGERDIDVTLRLHESAQQFDERLNNLLERITGIEKDSFHVRDLNINLRKLDRVEKLLEDVEENNEKLTRVLRAQYCDTRSLESANYDLGKEWYEARMPPPIDWGNEAEIEDGLLRYYRGVVATVFPTPYLVQELGDAGYIRDRMPKIERFRFGVELASDMDVTNYPCQLQEFLQHFDDNGKLKILN